MIRIRLATVFLLLLVFATLPSKLMADQAGQRFAALGRAVGECIKREARLVAAKQVDLETASIAVLARCKREMETFRQFVSTGIPNFNPQPDWWDKEIEPGILKRAREAVALARTR
jgi:hypothetical protein